MRKIYKNRLPKNMEASSINAKVVDGEIIVEVEMKERFQPKDGDFLFFNSCMSNGVFIYKDEEDSSFGCYYAMQDFFDGKTKTAENCSRFAPKYSCRYATEQEKTKFLERLEKEYHKKWNPETKQLEDIRWRAKYGGVYFSVDECGFIFTAIDLNSTLDNPRHSTGNYFRTEKAAMPYAEKLKELFKNSKAE